MTYEEAVAVINLMGNSVRVWGDSGVYIDVYKGIEPVFNYAGGHERLIRNSAPYDDHEDAKRHLIRWVEMDMPEILSSDDDREMVKVKRGKP